MSTISPSDLRSLGSSVFDSWLLLVVAELRPRGLASSHQLVCGVWGWRRPDAGPATSPGINRRLWRGHGTTPPPSTQVAEERLWLTPFQAFKFLCLVCGGISVKKGPVTWNTSSSHFDRSLECYHGYINVRTQWPQTLYLRRPLMVSWFWIEQNYSLKCVAVGFNFYW